MRMHRNTRLLLAGLALLLAGLALQVAIWWHPLLRAGGVEPHTPGAQYNWWSGIGSILVPPILQVGGIALLFWWHHQCHEVGCYRWAKHPAAGGLVTYCRHHHPEAEGGDFGREHVHRLHWEHKAATHGHASAEEARKAALGTNTARKPPAAVAGRTEADTSRLPKRATPPRRRGPGHAASAAT